MNFILASGPMGCLGNMDANSHGNRDIQMVFRISEEYLGLAGSQRAF